MTKHWTDLASASLATLLALFAPTPLARADIFEWQYINPVNPDMGKQPSTTLTPGGAGVNAVPGANLSNRNLTKAYLIGADLSYYVIYDVDGNPIEYVFASLSNANLSQADLTNANLLGATLTGANLTGVEVRGTGFVRNSFYAPGSGLTTSQLYSTASYQAHDLTAIGLRFNNLAGVNLAGQDLTDASFTYAMLTGANFSQANLTNTSLGGAKLTGANLSGAEVRGADFDNFGGTGITITQLYSTGSYQTHDLTGIGLTNNDLAGANLSGQNLTNAGFGSATLTNANFSQANLTNAYLSSARLTDANLTEAEVRGAAFHSGMSVGQLGITAAQLYSTASYQAHDLSGIVVAGTNLAGINLGGQNLTNAGFQGGTLANANLSQANLTNANFSIFYSYGYHVASNLTGANLSQANLTNANCAAANLTGANLSHANLANAYFSGYYYAIYDENGQYIGDEFSPGANLTNANLSGADARGASFYLATLSGANTNNLIQSNGHIAGLDLTSGASLVVRDYDGNPAAAPPTGPLPIVVDQHLAIDATGTLRLVFDADPWNSTISFAPGIPVALGGALELTFASDVNLASQVGRTLDLFDWTGVTPTGAFTVSSPYTWNLSNLYTTGEVTLTALAAIPGDFNNNGVVDAADYIAWRKTDGTPAGYNAWRTHFGQPSGSGAGASVNSAVPEPTTLMLLIAAAVGVSTRRLRSWRVS